MRFTVADVERFKKILKIAEPTHHACMPPTDQLPPPPLDVCYTLYSVHEFDDFLDALNKYNEHMGRYVLTATGQLCFGREGEPGKRIPEHWQMLGQDTMIIAAGNIFVEKRKITSLNDQSASPTGLLSLIYTLRALHNSDLPLALRLELIQSIPDNDGEYSSFMTLSELQNIIDNDPNFEAQPGYELMDDDLDNIRELAEPTTRPPTPHPFGQFGFFFNDNYNDDNVRVNLKPGSKPDLNGAPETKTTAGVATTS
tara:strand:+ start:121668 stop:122432 length:765 start_codon:yes stop_codon:yes gene_type:complete